VSLSVASVTVSYNALRLLPRQIEALLGQTRPLQEIVVVDNASTDGAPEWLAERYPQVKVLRMPENVGIGGALERGLTYAALNKQHDWVWTFDGDSVPNDDALEALLAGINSLRDVERELGMVAAVPVYQETGAQYEPLLWRDGFVKPPAELTRQSIWFADLVITSGCMVRGEMVQKIGLPRTDFFIDFVDFEYCLRARARGYKIAVITRAKLAHEIGNAQEIRLAGYSYLRSSHTPLREYYMTRNLVYAAWWLYPNRSTKCFALHRVGKHVLGVLLFGSQKLPCLVKIAQGFWDGLHETLGVRFRPEDAQSTAPPETHTKGHAESLQTLRKRVPL
jgi:GT2 family glycosyltransferase